MATVPTTNIRMTDLNNVFGYGNSLSKYYRAQYSGGSIASSGSINYNLFSGKSSVVGLPGLCLWLDSTDSNTLFQNTAGTTPVTATGQSVACWKDKSSNAVSYTSGAVPNQSGMLQPPVYSNDGIYNIVSFNNFSGGSGTYNSATTQGLSAVGGFPLDSTGFITFVVAKASGFFTVSYFNSYFTFTDNETQFVDFDAAKGNSGMGFVNTNNQNVGVYPDTTTLTTTRQIQCLESTTTGGKFYINGSNLSNTSYAYTQKRPLPNGSTVWIGNQAPGQRSFSGFINELLIFNNTSVSTQQRQTVEGYLAWKWGLQASLPAGHPYLSAKP